mmetsp:Transcript_6505/g.17397  ORF Transcript_6505/g.17397 Transcript_6505/m.17397 type:complete len:126 (-) Transcript_6505:149-526(-)
MSSEVPYEWNDRLGVRRTEPSRSATFSRLSQPLPGSRRDSYESVTYVWNEKFTLRPDEPKRSASLSRSETLGTTVKRMLSRPSTRNLSKRASKESEPTKKLRRSSRSFVNLTADFLDNPRNKTMM